MGHLCNPKGRGSIGVFLCRENILRNIHLHVLILALRVAGSPNQHLDLGRRDLSWLNILTSEESLQFYLILSLLNCVCLPHYGGKVLFVNYQSDPLVLTLNH